MCHLPLCLLLAILIKKMISLLLRLFIPWPRQHQKVKCYRIGTKHHLALDGTKNAILNEE